MAELEEENAASIEVTGDQITECVFEIHIRDIGDEHCLAHVEVSALQASANEGSLFQVASNFNACENASFHTDIAVR